MNPGDACSIEEQTTQLGFGRTSSIYGLHAIMHVDVEDLGDEIVEVGFVLMEDAFPTCGVNSIQFA